MNTQLVEIQPRELKFIFEVKKQSLCVVHLANVTNQYVAFKVKTTSPKKYCVRPNVGIIKPKSAYDFTVTMQAQKSAPSDLQCKDKFLLQSTVVPFGTTEEEITPGMFIKESQKYIEETKLRVVLTSAPNSPAKSLASSVSKQETSYETWTPKEPLSPVLLPVNGVIKQEPSYETSKPLANVASKQEASHETLTPKEPHSPVLLPVNGVIKQEASYETLTLKEPHSPVLLPVNGVFKQEPFRETSMPKDNLQNGVENSRPPDLLIKQVEAVKIVKNMEESTALKVMDYKKSVPAQDDEFYADGDEKSKQVKDLEEAKLTLIEDIEELRSKISDMETKLVEAEFTIEKLKEEKSYIIREKETLKQDLAISRTKSTARKIQVGFPPLFVCMVALISLMIGSLFRA